MAYTETTFAQRVVSTRERFLKLSESQLLFGQLPLLQIDGLELVQSQAIVRHLAKRSNLCGNTPEEEAKCDMIAECILDLVKVMTAIPFLRDKGQDVGIMAEKWLKMAPRLEYCIASNAGSPYLVGESVTYCDVLLAHVLTWFVEEAGGDLMKDFPLLVDLQILILQKESLQRFLAGRQFYKVGDSAYCKQVSDVLGRKI